MKQFWIKFVKLIFTLCIKIKTKDIINTELIALLHDTGITKAFFKIDEIAEYFMQTPLISDKNKNKLFGSKSEVIQSCLSIEPLSSQQNRAMTILKHFKNDSKIIDGIFFKRLKPESLLDLICGTSNIITNKLIAFLTQNDNIIRYRHQWQKLLVGREENNPNYLRPFWRAVQNISPYSQSSTTEDGYDPVAFVKILLNCFKDDTSMLYYLLGSNEYISSKICSKLIKIPGGNYYDTHEIMSILLNETNISATDKYQWFKDNLNSIFVPNMNSRRGNSGPSETEKGYLLQNINVIMTYFSNHKKSFSHLVRFDGWTIDPRGSILHWICKCKDTKFLQIILNCKVLSLKEKLELFATKDSNRDYVISSMTEKHAKLLFNSLDPDKLRQKEMRAVVGDDCGTFIYTICVDHGSNSSRNNAKFMLEVFKYFDGDTEFIMQLWNTDWYDDLLKQDKAITYLFLESSLSDKHKMKLLTMVDWSIIMKSHEDDAFEMDNSMVAIINFLRRDRKLLLQMLLQNKDQIWIKWFAQKSNGYFPINPGSNRVLSINDHKDIKQIYDEYGGRKYQYGSK